jgi:CubicO group peptidase (beta-lactamase class C family)
MRQLFALLLLSLSAVAQNTQRMDEVVRSYADQQKFMGSVLVAKGDQVVFQKSYGYANLEWKTPNVDDGKYRLGSITKQFTAACILLLEEQGKLSTSDPVKKFYAEAPAAWDKVTLHHLLSHTSGIPNFTSFPDYGSTETLPTTPEKLILRFRDKPLDFAPGTKWDYSNSNYILLGYIVEQASGMPYGDFLQKNIFDKLGMKDTGLDTRPRILEHRVYGYTPAPQGIVNTGYIDMSIPFSAGALYSTTGDLLKWSNGLFGGKLLKPESLTKMTTPVLQDYAYGLGVVTKNGRKLIDHGGGIEGFNTHIAYYPDDQLTVITLANLNGPAADELAVKLAAIAHNEPVTLPNERREIPVAPAILQQYVGDYVHDAVTATVTLEGDQLYIQLTNQPKFPIYAESEARFFLKVVDAQLDFVKQGDKVTKAVLHQNGMDVEWIRK